MKKYWLKNRMIFSFLFAIILGVILNFVFINDYIDNSAYNYDKTSIVKNTAIDYVIPQPTKEQLNDIKKMEFVDDVFGYYYSKTNIEIGGKQSKEIIILSDCLDSIEFTMYSSKRLIEESNKEYDNPIYIDFNYKNKYNLKLGDEIKLLSTTFNVSAIYENNYYFNNGALFIPLQGAFQDTVEPNFKSYSAAFLKTNDATAANAFFRNYKPLGRLKDRSSFNSDEAYQIHYNSWKSASYYNEITNYKEKFDINSLKRVGNIYLPSILMVILLMAFNFVMYFRKSERIYFKNKQSKKGITTYYILSNLLEVIILTLTVLVGVYFKINSINTLYLPMKLFNDLILIVSISLFVSFVLILTQNLLISKFNSK